MHTTSRRAEYRHPLCLPRRFFLAVLQHQKSTYAEWIIIVLIAAEMFIGIAGLCLHMMPVQEEKKKASATDSAN